MKKMFLTLLTIFALTFPGMSVCATEQQTGLVDAGDSEETINQEILDSFSDTGIYYYNPDYDQESSTEETMVEMYKLILSQKEQIQALEEIVQEKDAQIALLQRSVDHFWPIIVASVILIIGLIIYAVYLWRLTHDKSDSKIVDFRRHT